jgi:hypothetical protein
MIVCSMCLNILVHACYYSTLVEALALSVGLVVYSRLYTFKINRYLLEINRRAKWNDTQLISDQCVLVNENLYLVQNHYLIWIDYM